MADLRALFDESGGTCILRVHVQPGAGKDQLAGVHGDAVKLRVRAPARDGAANASVPRVLAAQLGLRPRDVELLSGFASRSKKCRVHVDAEMLLARLAAALPPGG